MYANVFRHSGDHVARTEPLKMEVQGYPQFLILLVVLLGAGLACVRPYAAFLFSVLLLTAGHVDRFNQTRLAGLGPYFNLGDACMLVALLAFFSDRIVGRKPIRVPQVVLVMFFVLTFPAAQSLWKWGWTYDTLRACRWAIQFPLAYFLGANMVTSETRVKRLIGVLLAGALLAAGQHVLGVVDIWRTKSISMETYHRIRTIGFWAGCMPSAFLIAAAIWTKPRGARGVVLYTGGGLLLFASLLLNQTRSLWIGTAGAVMCVILLFGRHHRMRRIMNLAVCLLLLFVAFGLLCQHLLPGIDISQIVTDRVQSLMSSSPDANVHLGTRARAFRAEMGCWLKGTLIWGRGLQFFQTIHSPEPLDQRIAFNHLGYVTYLAQMGLIGLLAYGVFLPLTVLNHGLWLWQDGNVSTDRYLGLLGAASLICLSLMFAGSSHFLILGYEAPGVLYGAMWARATLNVSIA